MGSILRSDKRGYEDDLKDLVKAIAPYLEPDLTDKSTFMQSSELSFSMGGLARLHFGLFPKTHNALIKHLLHLHETN